MGFYSSAPIVVDTKVSAEINHYLNVPQEVDDADKTETFWEQFYEKDNFNLADSDSKISYTAKFLDGKEMDIMLCSGAPNSAPWTQAVLFDRNGSELAYTEPKYDFFGEWTLEYNNIEYSATVVESRDVYGLVNVIDNWREEHIRNNCSISESVLRKDQLLLWSNQFNVPANAIGYIASWRNVLVRSKDREVLKRPHDAESVKIIFENARIIGIELFTLKNAETMSYRFDLPADDILILAAEYGILLGDTARERLTKLHKAC